MAKKKQSSEWIPLADITEKKYYLNGLREILVVEVLAKGKKIAIIIKHHMLKHIFSF